MSLNLEMLQVVRLAPRLLGDSAELIAQFLYGLINDDGGFCDRSGKSDLYYTSFGVGGLLGLQQDLPLPKLRQYIERFGDGDGIDLVHLSCLARCLHAVWSRDDAWRTRQMADRVDTLLSHVESHRAEDGGFNVERGSARGSVYGCFLAVGAYQDLGRTPPEFSSLRSCIESFQCDDGGYANGMELPIGLTPPSSGAATLLRHWGCAEDPRLTRWLWERYHRSGGFCVMPGIEVPDLLSTATALHALVGVHADLKPIQESCLDFVDSLWNARGGFHGSWEDDDLDCEYTYYGLLVLGHLSLRN